MPSWPEHLCLHRNKKRFQDEVDNSTLEKIIGVALTIYVYMRFLHSPEKLPRNYLIELKWDIIPTHILYILLETQWHVLTIVA